MRAVGVYLPNNFDQLLPALRSDPTFLSPMVELSQAVYSPPKHSSSNCHSIAITQANKTSRSDKPNKRGLPPRRETFVKQTVGLRSVV